MDATKAWWVLVRLPSADVRWGLIDSYDTYTDAVKGIEDYRSWGPKYGPYSMMFNPTNPSYRLPRHIHPFGEA